MKFTRKIAAIAATTVAALALAACSSAATPGATDGGAATGGAPAGDGSKPYIAIVSKGFQHQFWQSVKAGAEKAAEEFGVEITFEGPDTESNVQQQVTMLETALGKSPAAIALAALDSQAVAPMLQQAQASNIPVIAFDSGVESEIPLTTVATDNKAAAALAAQHLAEAIGHDGKIAMVVHDQTSTSGQDRRDGFKEYIEANEPNIEIVDIQYGGGDQAKSADLAKAILNANPDLKGIYGSNEGSAIGVVHAVAELGLSADQIKVVGFDSGKAQIDAINSGAEFGAVTQDPVSMGYETVKAAVAAINGESLEKRTDTDFHWFDKNNINDEVIQAAIYE